MKNIIKQRFVEANRYDEIITIIQYLTKDHLGSYPVEPFINKYNQTSWRVDGSLVDSKAEKYLNLISSEEYDTLPSMDDFENFYQVIHTNLEILLHNYANSISHRTIPTVNMEKVRCLQIIQYSLDNLDIDINRDWQIPNGWGKINN